MSLDFAYNYVKKVYRKYKTPLKLDRIDFYKFMFVFSFIFSIILYLFLVNISKPNCDGFACLFSSIFLNIIVIFSITIITLFNVLLIFKYEFKNKSIKKHFYIFFLYILIFLSLFTFVVFDDPLFKNKITEQINSTKYFLDNKLYDYFNPLISKINLFKSVKKQTDRDNRLSFESKNFKILNDFVESNDFYGCLNYLDKLKIPKKQDYLKNYEYKDICCNQFAVKNRDLSYCEYSSINTCYLYNLNEIIKDMYFNNEKLNTDLILSLCDDIPDDYKKEECKINFKRDFFKIKVFDLRDGTGMPNLIIEYPFMKNNNFNNLVKSKITEKVELFNNNYKQGDFLDISFDLNFINENYIVLTFKETSTVLISDHFLSIHSISNPKNHILYSLIYNVKEDRLLLLDDVFINEVDYFSKLQEVSYENLNYINLNNYFFDQNNFYLIIDINVYEEDYILKNYKIISIPFKEIEDVIENIFFNGIN